MFTHNKNVKLKQGPRKSKVRTVKAFPLYPWTVNVFYGC